MADDRTERGTAVEEDGAARGAIPEGEGHHTRVVNINLGEFMMPLEVTNETPKRKNFPPGVEKTCLSVSV